jgi:Phage integrase family
VTPNGLPLNPANVRRLVKRIAAAADIDGGCHPIRLRHTATSVFSAIGVAPELLADLLGHVDTRMVFRHYPESRCPGPDFALICLMVVLVAVNGPQHRNQPAGRTPQAQENSGPSSSTKFRLGLSNFSWRN